MVGIWLPGLPSFSSNVTMSRLSLALAQLAYALRWRRSHAFPAETEQSCMSSHRFGVIQEKLGSAAKSPDAACGKRSKDFVAEAGTLLKSAHGMCLRA